MTQEQMNEINALRARIAELVEPIIEAFCKASEAFKEAVAAIAGYASPYRQHYAQAAAAHPRWHHLANHASRGRTRNKWTNALWREAGYK